MYGYYEQLLRFLDVWNFYFGIWVLFRDLGLCDNFGIIYKKGYTMRFWLVILSFFLLGCQVVDSVAVPINDTANKLSNSSSLYEDNQTNTSLHMSKRGLVLEKEF